MWGLIYGTQQCGAKWSKPGGWFFAPGQTPATHALYVIRHVLGGCVDERGGVAILIWPLRTPPAFIYDETTDGKLLKFDEYARTRRDVPSFSGKFRSVDGGGNQEKYPFLGQGGRGYAMNEDSATRPSAENLPTADALVEALLQRNEKSKINAINGVNALATWVADVAIHEFFRSDPEKPWINLHSSYLDLQTLYGYTEAIAMEVRDGARLNKVAETRLDTVPQAKAILELLRREHNFVCDELQRLYPNDFSDDDTLYQQARLIMGGVFISIILREYGVQMFGETPTKGDFLGFAELRHNYGGEVGNHVTFNFNLIYRWHNAVPLDYDDSPKIETDDELRTIFKEMLTTPSGGFGPSNVPKFLVEKGIPRRMIETARKLGAPTLNDFRRRFGRPYDSFDDMCGGDKLLASKLATFYRTVDDVELAVGFHCEKSMSAGWGLGISLGQAIIADALCSIRHDRFYTSDFTPAVYTDFGFKHAKTTVLADLLNRHLGLNIDRATLLTKLPDWRQLSWTDVPHGFDARGRPIQKSGSAEPPRVAPDTAGDPVVVEQQPHSRPWAL